MQSNAGESSGAQPIAPGVAAKPQMAESAATIDSAVLGTLDVALFRALRKLGTPKQRICSSLWLSYEEYDELSRLI